MVNSLPSALTSERQAAPPSSLPKPCNFLGTMNHTWIVVGIRCFALAQSDRSKEKKEHLYICLIFTAVVGLNRSNCRLWSVPFCANITSWTNWSQCGDACHIRPSGATLRGHKADLRPVLWGRLLQSGTKAEWKTQVFVLLVKVRLWQ